MKKNVIIISYSYPPNNVAGAQRPYTLAKYIDKNKYNVKVITCSNPDLPIGESIEFNPSLEGVEIIKIKSRISGSSSGNLRKGLTDNKTSLINNVKATIFKFGQKLIFPDKGMFWFSNVKSFLKNNSKLMSEADIVFSTSPGLTNHQIALFIKKMNPQTKWIADFRDFNYLENWDSKKGLKAYLHKRLEFSIVSKASALTFVTKTMVTAYQLFYPQFKHKMYAVYNGFDIKDFNQTVSTELNEKITFFYAGTFYGGTRSPFPLLLLTDAMISSGIIKKDEISIQIAGNIDEEIISEMKKFNSFECIELLGSLPRSKVIELMSKATFLWLIVANIKSHYQTIPIKLFEYIASRRPIVNFAPDISECTQIIGTRNIGFSFDTLKFDFEKSEIKFRELIVDAKKGKFLEPLSNENLESFSWQQQISLIENLF